MASGWTRNGRWALIGPQRRWVPWDDMRRRTRALGRYASKIRRLFGVGPYVVYVMRYEPGERDE